jgi:hypothetical protein
MNTEVLRLFKKGFLLLAIIFLLDRGIGSLVGYYLKRETQGDSSVTTYALTKASEDVIIFGSSRAAHHYVPDIIRQETDLSSFNIGRDGMNLSYYFALLDGILAHHTPKVVILDLNLNEFMLKSDKEHSMVSSLLPYIGDNSSVSKLIIEKEPIEYWKAKISMLYRYNSLPASIIQHNLGIGQKNDNGYEPLKGNKLKFIADTIENNSGYEENPELVKKFTEFVQILQQKGVTLYVVVSPSARKTRFNSKKTASKILLAHGLKLHDYSGFSSSNRLTLFYDGTHMNDDGARIFTQTMVQDLMIEEPVSEL